MNPCAKCGGEMVEILHGDTPQWVCLAPLNSLGEHYISPDQHRIAALEKELEEARAYNDRLRGECVGHLTDAGVCMLADTDPCAPGEIPRAIREIARKRDEALTKLRAREADLLALRAALGTAIQHIELIDDDSESLGFVAKTKVLLPGLREAFSSTADTAQEWMAKLERETLEKRLGGFAPIIHEIVVQLRIAPLPVPVLNWQRYQWALENIAAILDEKAP